MDNNATNNNTIFNRETFFLEKIKKSSYIQQPNSPTMMGVIKSDKCPIALMSSNVKKKNLKIESDARARGRKNI